MRCDAGCDVVFASREAWACADPLPFRPSVAWIDAHPAVVAARAAEAEYLRQHPEFAALWRIWSEAADAMVDPDRSAAADGERAATDAYQALPSWFTNTMTTLLGNIAGAVMAAEAGWRASPATS